MLADNLVDMPWKFIGEAYGVTLEEDGTFKLHILDAGADEVKKESDRLLIQEMFKNTSLEVGQWH